MIKAYAVVAKATNQILIEDISGECLAIYDTKELAEEAASGCGDLEVRECVVELLDSYMKMALNPQR